MTNLAYSNKYKAEQAFEDLKRKCRRKVAEANRRSDEVIQQYADNNKLALEARLEAESYKLEQQNMLDSIKVEIDIAAKKKVSSAVLQLTEDNELSKEKYKKYYIAKYVAQEAWHVLIFTFCIVWCIIQALSSNYFRGYVVKIITLIMVYINDRFVNINSLTLAIANITNEIPIHTVSVILYWIVYILVGLILLILFYLVPPAIIIGGCYMYLKSEFFDLINQWIMIGSSILLISFTSEMVYTPPINLLVVWFILQGVAPLLRHIIIPFLRLSKSTYHNMDFDEQLRLRSNIKGIILTVFIIILLMLSLKSCCMGITELFY